MKNRISQRTDLAPAKLGSPKRKTIWVWRLKGSERGTLVMYSPSPWGYTVHYDPRAKRSSPHFTDSGTCPGCLDELPTKEVFYVYGWHSEKNKLVFLEMPSGAAEKLTAMLAHGETLRGLAVHVVRTPADNGRLNFRMVTVEHGRKELPQDVDPRETLFRMWGIEIGDPRSGKECPTHENGFSKNGTK